MAIEINETIKTQLLEKQNVPIELYELYLDDFTLRYANWNNDVEFPTGSGNIYTAWTIRRGAIRLKIETGLDSVDVSFDNVDRTFSALVIDSRYEFRKRNLKIKKVFETHLDDEDYAIVMFDGDMDSPKVDQNWFTITVKSKIASLNKECPRRKYLPMCQWVFGDVNCDPYIGTGIAVKKIYTGQIITGGGSALCIRLSEFPSPLSEDYFRTGYIKITSGKPVIEGGNNGISRQVQTSSVYYVSPDWVEVNLYHSFPNTYDMAGETFEIGTNCDKTKQDCIAKDNIKNYGGFLFAVKGWIGKKLIVGY